jgi:hypothetical protein
MTTMKLMESRSLTTAETAKEVRKELKRLFPGTKFSVRSSTYAGGSSISVRWTDGPRDRTNRTTGERGVWETVQRFAGATFDGMTDMKSYRGDVLLANEDGSLDMVRYGADYVQTDRRISREYREEAAAKIAEVSGQECDLTQYGDDGGRRNGDGWNTRYEVHVDIDSGEVFRCSGSGEYGSTLMHRITAPTR